ncbi:MAG TPA: MBL fold metallo-hydrolase [Candidatus Xenobia bacterium]|jgi:glyoxylase-like metal-dependent hydrolase (beta-lactamase superfamily II)
MSSDLFFKQLPLGSMANYAYFIGSQRTREALVVDPAWDVQQVIDTAQSEGYKLVGALVTHFHPDHIGGSMMPMMNLTIEGLPTLLKLAPMRIYANKNEAQGIKFVTGLSDTDLTLVESGETVQVGDVVVRFIHTPGHTPGSQCFLVEDKRLVSGDTLFIQGCGRVDLPGADPAAMYESLTQKLAKLPDDVVLYPGHNYGGKSSTMGEEKRLNRYLQVPTLQDWLHMMGR